jgi:hypothetical protein
MKYNSVGFVEALIAIAVAGIASVVLMGIAADTYAQVLYNEMSDQMTEISIEGSEMVKKIADEHNTSEEEPYFPSIGGNYCYAIEGNYENPSFPKQGENFISTCSYSAQNRSSCFDAVSSRSNEYFTIFCMTTDSEYENDLVVGKVVTGLVDCDGEDRSGKCINGDYEYYMAVKVIQE